jgi:hypothetical protein
MYLLEPLLWLMRETAGEGPSLRPIKTKIVELFFLAHSPRPRIQETGIGRSL